MAAAQASATAPDEPWCNGTLGRAQVNRKAVVQTRSSCRPALIKLPFLQLFCFLAQLGAVASGFAHLQPLFICKGALLVFGVQLRPMEGTFLQNGCKIAALNCDYFFFRSPEILVKILRSVLYDWLWRHLKGTAGRKITPKLMRATKTISPKFLAHYLNWLFWSRDGCNDSSWSFKNDTNSLCSASFYDR